MLSARGRHTELVEVRAVGNDVVLCTRLWFDKLTMTLRRILHDAGRLAHHHVMNGIFSITLSARGRHTQLVDCVRWGMMAVFCTRLWFDKLTMTLSKLTMTLIQIGSA